MKIDIAKDKAHKIIAFLITLIIALVAIIGWMRWYETMRTIS